MPAGRKIPPLWLGGEIRASGRDTEVGTEDAVLVDANKEEKLRRRRIVDLGFLGETRGGTRPVGIGQAVDGLAHIVAARASNMQDFAFRRSHARLVGRTPIDIGGFVVTKEQPVFDILGGGIEGRHPGTPGHVVADIGAGTGVLSLPLAQKVAHVTAIDPSMEMIGVLKSKIKDVLAINVHILLLIFEKIAFSPG